MKHTIHVLISLCSFFSSYAHPDSLQAIEHRNTAISYLEKGDLENFGLYKKKAIDYFKSQNNYIEWIQCHRNIAETYQGLENYDACLMEIDEVFTDSWREPETEAEFIKLAWHNAYKGYVNRDLGKHAEVVDNFLLAKEIFDSLRIEDCGRMGRYIYSQLGNAYNMLSDYKTAGEYHSRRIQICMDEENWEEVGDAYLDLGSIYFNLDEFSKAITFFEEGLKYDFSQYSYKVDILSYLADSYIKVGDEEKMEFFIDKAKAIIKISPMTEEERRSSLFDNFTILGKQYRDQNELEKAENYFLQAMSFLDAKKQSHKKQIAFTHMYLGSVYNRWQKYEKALQEYHFALHQFITEFDNKDIHSLPTKDQLIEEPNLILLFQSRADIYIGLLDQNKSIPFVAEWVMATKSLANLVLANEVDRLLLQEYALEDSKFTALRMNRSIKYKTIQINYDLWKKKPTKEFAEAMFSMSEQSRASVLLEGMKVSEIINSKAKEEVLQQVEIYNNQIDSLEEKIAMLDVASGVDEGLFFFLRDIKEEKRKFLNKSKGFQTVSENTKVTTISEVKENLQPNQALVEYFIHDTFAFIFIISADTFFVKKIEWNEAWANHAKTLNQVIYEKNDLAYTHQAKALYDSLVQPVIEVTSAPHLIIIPDGDLWNINFETLLTKEVSEEDITKKRYREFPFLIRRKVISSDFSATLHFEKNKNKIKGDKIMAFAPKYRKLEDSYLTEILEDSSDSKKRNSLAPLNYNEGEVQEITSLTSGNFYFDSNATKENFLKEIPGARILHIAGHGKTNLDEPKLSFLAFSNTEEVEENDFILYARELYNSTRSIPLEMVVLSACETGTGPVSKGEGVMSLARAFTFFGAQSIITTLWSIPDQSTKNIMVFFYEGLVKGESKEVALRNAKLKYISSEEYELELKHPYFWAAFVPYGNMELVNFSSFSWMPYFIGGFVVFAIFFLLWLRRRKNQSNNF